MNYSILENNPVISYQRDSKVVLTGLDNMDVPEEWDVERAVEDPYDAVTRPQVISIDTPVSDFVEFAFKIPDKKEHRIVPFSFGDNRRYLRQIYDSSAKKILLKAGRQSEKSTLIGNLMLSYACLVPAIRCLYVSPSNMQTKTFCKDRLDEPLYLSEDKLMKWTNRELIDNQQLKRFLNLSQITLRYAFLTADRVRGISADFLVIDEIQDILTDNIPVIEECLFTSPMKLYRYSGTPKSLDNTIEIYWNKFSTQNEWVIPCHRHTFMVPGGGLSNKYYNIVSEDSLGEESLLCDRCGKPISPIDPDCQWASMNPGIHAAATDPDQVFEGYRIPQVITPMCDFAEVKQKQKDYPRAKFLNEKLALASDEGTKPITRDELIACCNPHIRIGHDYLERAFKKAGGGTYPVFMGIDWLGGSQSNSFTEVTMASYFDSNKLSYFYYRRFEGVEADPNFQIQEIAELIQKWQPHIVGADYGGGLWPNDNLIRKFGANRVVKFQYSRPSKPIIWDKDLSRFLVHRTVVISSFFNAIKRGGILEFPNWDQWKSPHGDDFLNVFSEFNERTNENDYKKTPGKTDDAFHASIFAFLASMIIRPRPDLIISKDVKR